LAGDPNAPRRPRQERTRYAVLPAADPSTSSDVWKAASIEACRWLLSCGADDAVPPEAPEAADVVLEEAFGAWYLPVMLAIVSPPAGVHGFA